MRKMQGYSFKKRGVTPSVGTVLDFARPMPGGGALRSGKVTFFQNRKGDVICDWCKGEGRRPFLQCTGKCKRRFCGHGLTYVAGVGSRCFSC